MRKNRPGSRGSRKDGLQKTEAVRDKRLEQDAGKFFDDVIANIREAELVQIFGPGEAKSELVKYLETEGLKERIVDVETMDKMSDNQIAVKVQEYFFDLTCARKTGQADPDQME